MKNPDLNLSAETIAACFGRDVYKCVLSAPTPDGAPYKRATVRLYGGLYQIEKLTETQAFHENTSYEGALAFITGAMNGRFRQLNAWDGKYEYSLKVSKKGKTLAAKRKNTAGVPAETAAHDRAKTGLLEEGIVCGPLLDMGVITPDGRIVKAMRGKHRQINRFLELLNDEVKKLDKSRPLRVIDFGCGKSYLTFIMYHYFTEIVGFDVQMTGLDLKGDVIEKCSASAAKYGYKNLCFHTGGIEDYKPDEKADIVVSLHACDTATDYALFSAINREADLIFCAPCCQHEANAQIKTERLTALTRYGVVKERLAALATDAIRACLLEHMGYKTQIIEFVDFEHTPKNIMIRAVKRTAPTASSSKALEEAETLIAEFGLNPALYRLLVRP